MGALLRFRVPALVLLVERIHALLQIQLGVVDAGKLIAAVAPTTLSRRVGLRIRRLRHRLAVMADVSLRPHVREQQRNLRTVKLRLTDRRGTDNPAFTVVVELGELARLPTPKTSRCDAQLES